MKDYAYTKREAPQAVKNFAAGLALGSAVAIVVVLALAMAAMENL